VCKLLVALLAPVTMVPVIYVLGRKFGRYVGWLVFAALVFTASMLVTSSEAFSGGVVEEVYSWTPAVDLKFGLRADGVSITVALIINVLSVLASVYSIAYMEHEKNPGAYFSFFLMLVVGMLGVILSTNLIQFYIFWEIMVIPVIFLIAEWGSGSAKQIALKTFIFTHIGALFLLLGILITHLSLGTFEMYEIPVRLSRMDLGLQSIVVILFMIGFTVKMAILPLHTWLPDAHGEAPTPISVLLSGAMIECGAYAVARILVTFFTEATASLLTIFAVLAVATMIYGGVMALGQTDIKRLLAYSSISQMGYIFFGLITVSTVGLTGALFHVVNHAIFKGLLFMCAGAVIHEAGTRDMRFMGGLWRKMPITFVAGLVGALSLSGIPPLNGFWSKDLILAAAYEAEMYPFLVVMFIASALTFAYNLRWIYLVFLGKGAKHSSDRDAHEAPLLMIAPMLVLVGLCFISGLIEIGLVGIPFASIVTHPIGLDHVHVQIEATTVTLSLLALVLGGIPTYLLYYRKILSAEKLRAGLVWKKLDKLISEEFYFDKIYYKIFVDRTYRLCWRFYRWIDVPLDMLNYGVARSIVSFSSVSNAFDIKVLDGFVNGFANTLIKVASTVRRVQTGVAQYYVLAYATGVIVLILLILTRIVGIW